MTNRSIELEAALRLALEALKAMQMYAAAEKKGLRICDEAIIAAEEALMSVPDGAQPAVVEPHKQEPVPSGVIRTLVSIDKDGIETWKHEPFYTTPPYVPTERPVPEAHKRTWVGLTDEEIWKDDAIMSANSGYGATFDTLRDIVRAVEAKLKEKNTRNGGCL